MINLTDKKKVKMVISIERPPCVAGHAITYYSSLLHGVTYDKCEAYIDDANVVTIKSPKFPLCNYYPCRIKMHNMEFPSSEHAYHWRFLMYIDKPELAQEVLDAETAAEAKAVASRVPRYLRRDWHTIKMSVMKEILHIKADLCPTFKQTLLDSTNCRLVEAVQGDVFWSSGLPPQLAATTKPEFFPGRNELGSILESVRLDLMKEIILGNQLGLNESFDHPQFNNTDEFDDLPLPPPILPHLSEDASSTSGLPLPSPPLCVTAISALPSSNVIPESPHFPSMVPPSSDQQVTLMEKDPEPIEQSVTPKNVHAVSASSLHDHQRENNKKLTKKSKSKQRQKSSANTSISTDQNSDSSRTISSMFDAMKPKLSPDKEADTTRDSQKVKLCTNNNS